MTGNDTPAGSTLAKDTEVMRKALPSWLAVWLQLPVHAESVGRVPSVDLARGVAVALMILSHSVVGLLPFDAFAPYGQIPIHLVTKFASSTFVLVFGIALAVAFLPKTGTPDWPRKRRRLLLSGLVVFFWYKLLTVVEMGHLAHPDEIMAVLLYQDFPSFVEILGFYAIALLWVPLLLPLWARMPLFLRLFSPALMAGAGMWLAANFHFWNSPQLQALLVEHEDYYTWGQLTRGPLILLGLLIGELLVLSYGSRRRRLGLAAALILFSASLFISFVVLARPDTGAALEAVARNIGKHPPELLFMLFSMGGALLILALSIAGGPWLARILMPVRVIGENALQAFIFHILVIFLGFRYLMGFGHSVSYEFALALAFGLLVATALWNTFIARIKAHR